MNMKSYDAAQKRDQVINSVDPCRAKLAFILIENTAHQRPKVIILFSCSTQLSINFQLHIKDKMVKNTFFLA